jgi:hypothetical protein
MMQFRGYGILPVENNGYLQPFTFTQGKKLTGENLLLLNGKSLQPGVHYYPLAFSGNGNGNSAVLMDVGFGIHAPALGHDDYTDIRSRLNGIDHPVFLISISNPESSNPHSQYAPYADLRTKVQTAVMFGASAVVFYNTDSLLTDPDSSLAYKSVAESVPVMFLTASGMQRLKEAKNTMDYSVHLEPISYTGYNVIGWINNNAPHTVVIGAHYDHLGNGAFGGSLHRGEQPEIHNGADDNASGTAMMIELGRQLKASGLKNNNYLFIGFSGEELGLYGSNYYAKNPWIPHDQVNYMINFDMVGRLDTQSRKLGLNGTGTSPAWQIVTRIEAGDLNIKTSESGVGPSDHTSFYLHDIPVLHFFSGTHNDYHKPADDEWKINYSGMADINQFVLALIDSLDDLGKLQFQKTKEDTMQVPQFTVTLGVVPDYMFDGRGMRIDGVTEGKPASKAGLKTGDVVIKLGDTEVFDMMSYMKALSLFKKGDRTTVVILRDNEELSADVQF